MNRQQYILIFGICAAWLCAVALFFSLMHNEVVYDAIGVFKTYVVTTDADGQRIVTLEKKPFNRIDNSALLHWDADIYKLIATHLYNPEHVWPGYKAFFPLFPFVWRLTGLSPTGIALLNFVFFVVGLLLLLSACLPKREANAHHPYTHSLSHLIPLIFCMPFLTIFLIPYSEALFFLLISLGLYGLLKHHYWIYFIGFTLGCMTRAAGTILLVAWIIADILYALHYRSSWRQMLRSLVLHLAPILVGVAVVMVIQTLSGGGAPLDFARAQSEWGKEWSLPSWPLTDWSEESKSVTQPLLFMLFIPALSWLCIKFVDALRGRGVAAHASHSSSASSIPSETDEWLVRVLSVLFFVGNIVLALFTQKGCMYSQARLLTCTPFFFFLVINLSGALTSHDRSTQVWRWVIIAFMLVTMGLCHLMLFKFQTLGTLITILFIVLVLFAPFKSLVATRVMMIVALILNVMWTAYLFNCFLSGGWIFT